MTILWISVGVWGALVAGALFLAWKRHSVIMLLVAVSIAIGGIAFAQELERSLG